MNPIKVLVVEDEVIVAQDIAGRLKKLGYIVAATKKMNQLIDDMLFMGRTESDQLKCNPFPINLVDFCQDLLAGLQLGNEKKHNIVFIQSEVTSAILDQQLLHTILSNLIVNAIKYSPNGGKVTLEKVSVSQKLSWIKYLKSFIGAIIPGRFKAMVWD